MGLSIDKEEFEEQDFADFADRLQQSLTILRELLSRPGFGEGPLTLGAELELPIIDKAGLAFPINRSLLAQSADSSLQLELDRFNIEYNATPVPLIGSPFTALQTQLTGALQHINGLAAAQGGRVVPIGILPTLSEADLQSQALTDLPRYRALSWALRHQRHAPFRVCIDGKEPLTSDLPARVLRGHTCRDGLVGSHTDGGAWPKFVATRHNVDASKASQTDFRERNSRIQSARNKHSAVDNADARFVPQHGHLQLRRLVDESPATTQT